MTTNQYIKKIDSSRTEPLMNMINTFLEAVVTDDKQGDRDEILRAKMVIPTIEAVLRSIHEGGREINIKAN
jgi:hypothetical protein